MAAIPGAKSAEKGTGLCGGKADGVVRRIRKAMQSTLEKMKATLLHADKKKAVT